MVDDEHFNLKTLGVMIKMIFEQQGAGLLFEQFVDQAEDGQ